jgi:hypothetical protein
MRTIIVKFFNAHMATGQWYRHLYLSADLAHPLTLAEVTKISADTPQWTKLDSLTLEEFCLLDHAGSIWVMYYSHIGADYPHAWVQWTRVSDPESLAVAS